MDSTYIEPTDSSRPSIDAILLPGRIPQYVARDAALPLYPAAAISDAGHAQSIDTAQQGQAETQRSYSLLSMAYAAARDFFTGEDVVRDWAKAMKGAGLLTDKDIRHRS